MVGCSVIVAILGFRIEELRIGFDASSFLDDVYNYSLIY
jgi:hypothetical protein